MKQMMKGKKRVKGTVLFTVVTVMLVMVLFLMSTLILTTSANRRSYYSYYQTQAQYAAQAALDAITNNAYSDLSFSQWVETNANVIGEKKDIYVTFDGSNLGLNDDISGIPDRTIAYQERTITGPRTAATPGTVQNVQVNQNAHQTVHCWIEKDATNYVWDEETGMAYPQDAWKITATAVVGSGNNQRSYTMVNHIYKNVRTPSDDTKNNKVDYTSYKWELKTTQGGGTSGGSQIKAVYTLAPTGTTNNIASYGPLNSNMTSIPYGRTKYNGKTALSFKNQVRTIGDVLFVGNMRPDTNQEFQFQEPGEGAVIWGDLIASTQGGMAVNAAISGGAKGLQPTATNKWDYRNDVNYVYVDGSFYYGTTAKDVLIGYKLTERTKSDMPVNLYAGAAKGNNGTYGMAVNGDVYLYDPSEESDIRGKAGVGTHLTAFVNQNVNKTNIANVPTLGGNLICNNKTLTLGMQGSEAAQAVEIAGDLIFTNPSGTLKIVGTVKVGGKIVCAGTLNNTGTLQNLDGTAYTKAITSGLTAAKTLMADSSYPSGYAGATPSGFDYSILPYAYRLDEIFTRYYRWDLAQTAKPSGFDTSPAIAAGLDNLMKESIAAGHSYQWDEVQGDGTPTVTTQTVVDVELHAGDKLRPGDNGFQWGSGAYWNTAWDGNVGDNVMTVTQDHVESHTEQISTPTKATYYVPYCEPHLTNNKGFIPYFRPTTTDQASANVMLDSRYSYTKVADFRTKFSTDSVQYPANATLPKRNVTINYHDETGAAKTQTLNNAYIINTNCEIDLSKYNNSVIYIDPTKGGHTDSTTPLAIVIKGTSTSNFDIQIITNNTAQFVSDDGSNYNMRANKVERTPVNIEYAGRREIFIFMEKGYQDLGSYGFAVYPSGLYGQLNVKKDLDIIGNPQYPGQKDNSGNWVLNSNWWDATKIPAADKYKYECVPNALVFGEAGATYDSQQGFFFGAEVLMPSSTLKTNNAKGYRGTSFTGLKYRETYDSAPQTGKTLNGGQNMSTIGSICVSDVKAGDNDFAVMFLGDKYRSPSTSTWDSNPSAVKNSSKAPNQDNGNDYFNNQYQGAS